MKITKATIIQEKHGADTVLLWTNLPSSMPKVSQQNLMLKFSAETGTGREYTLEKFGYNFPIKMIEE